MLQQPPKMAKKQKVAVKAPDPKRVQECRWDLSEERNFPALQYNVKHIQPFSCEGLPPDQAVTVFLETAQMFYPSGCCPENNDGRACGGNVNRSFWFEWIDAMRELREQDARGVVRPPPEPEQLVQAKATMERSAAG